MGARRYNQYCAAARALDIVGDRWTLLIVRELMLGPQRYSDLQHGLPGIGTNLLADRLKALEDADVIRRRRLPRPAAARVYELSERGRELEPIVVQLAAWGLTLLGDPDGNQEWRPEWSIVAMRATFRPEEAIGIDESYQFWVDDEPFWARVRNGQAATGRGEVDSPAMTVTADAPSFLDVAAGKTAPEDADTYRIDGDPSAFRRCVSMFSLPT